MNRKENLINHIKAKIDEKFAKVEVTPYQQQRLKCMAEIIELIEKYEESPLTLADLLGWEEDVEYELFDRKFMILADNKLYGLFDDKWFKCSFGINKYKELQQATKVEPKLKAYHVKDEYSYNCLMKELEEQGYIWISNTESTDASYWDTYENNTVIYCKENKRLTYSNLDHFNACKKNSYNLIEYHKEEPKFYAKIKGWELYKDNDRSYYWKYYIEDELFASYKDESEHYKTKFTKTEWNKLGINDSNADFEEVAE